MSTKTKLDGHIESMNEQPCAVDRLVALKNYAPAFMLAYERGELICKDTHPESARLAKHCSHVLAQEYEGNMRVGNIPPHDLETIIEILESVRA